MSRLHRPVRPFLLIVLLHCVSAAASVPPIEVVPIVKTTLNRHQTPLPSIVVETQVWDGSWRTSAWTDASDGCECSPPDLGIDADWIVTAGNSLGWDYDSPVVRTRMWVLRRKNGPAFYDVAKKWCHSVRQAYVFKGFGLSFKKSLKSALGCGLALRLPVSTDNFAGWVRRPELPQVSTSLCVGFPFSVGFCLTTTVYVEWLLWIMRQFLFILISGRSVEPCRFKDDKNSSLGMTILCQWNRKRGIHLHWQYHHSYLPSITSLLSNVKRQHNSSLPLWWKARSAKLGLSNGGIFTDNVLFSNAVLSMGSFGLGKPTKAPVARPLVHDPQYVIVDDFHAVLPEPVPEPVPEPRRRALVPRGGFTSGSSQKFAPPLSPPTLPSPAHPSNAHNDHQPTTVSSTVPSFL